jgi:hypothetical protein
MKKAAAPSILIAVVLLGLGVTAEAQQPKKVPRMGYLDSSARSVNAHFLEAFQNGLNELGWVEGKNITFECRFADGKGPAYQESRSHCGRERIAAADSSEPQDQGVRQRHRINEAEVR